jgi:hypothetical protein
MKTILTLVLMLLSFQAVFSQRYAENSLTWFIQYDTIVTPDYFNAEIIVAEYVKYEGRRRKMKAVLHPLDTLSKNLIAELNGLGFKGPFKKSIAERAGSSSGEKVYFDGKVLFQAAFQFNLTSRDSIELLFKGLKKEYLVSMKVKPKYDENALERVKEKLFAKGLSAVKDYAQKVADSNNLKIINQSHDVFTTGLMPNDYDIEHNYFIGEKKGIVIDLNDNKYTFSAMYTYFYTDK